MTENMWNMTNAELAEEVRDLRATFELRHKADVRAILLWRKATGKKLVLPDHADLCTWLLNQLALKELEATASGTVMLELQQENIELRKKIKAYDKSTL